MALVRRLPSDLIDRIAAGEVIERPASVVKELLENALDARAQHVEIDVEEGGLGRLTITDDGAGMSPEDALVALERHATSKLRTTEDLFAIRTFGFRGEALSSIASVSRLTLTTRPHDSQVGYRVVLHGGEVREQGSVGAPVGTTLDVRDLFFNTPARRKFMRAAATEQAHVVEACVRVLLGRGEVGLVLHGAGRRLLDVPRGGTDLEQQRERVLAILRRRVKAVFPFEHAQEGITVEGYITAPEEARRDSKGIWFFVNGRYVRDRTLQRALMDGYSGMLERGRYPVCVVRVTMDPGAVDVNVHPQKLEVRFANSRGVYRAVASAVTRAVAATPWLGRGGLALGASWSVSATPLEGKAPSPSAGFAARAPEGRAGGADAAPSALAAAGTSPMASVHEAPPVWNPSGAQLFPSSQQAPTVDLTGASSSAHLRAGDYILCNAADAVWAIDLRAWRAQACEDTLRQQAAANGVERRTVLFPESFAPEGPSARWLEAHWLTLEAHGFEIEPVGPGRYAIKAIPEALQTESNLRRLAQEVVDALCADPSGARVIALCGAHAARHPGGVSSERQAIEALRGKLLQTGAAPRWARRLSPNSLRALWEDGPQERKPLEPG